MTSVDIPDVVQILRENGYRATPQRLAIYEAIWKAGSHPTAVEIHRYAEKRDPTISKATVYKTLQLFADLGLVSEIGFRDESTRYDPEMNLHINVICDRCRNVEDYPVEEFESVITSLAKGLDFDVRGHSFDVHGICAKCKKIRGER